MMFNERLDLKLINLVKDNPVLYDQNNIKYMDFNAREVVWQRIGDVLKRPAADCKARWINIRDIYRRILRKTLKNPNHRTKLYKYDRELAFMKPFYRDILVQNTEFEWDDNTTACDNGEDDVQNDSDKSMDEKPIWMLKRTKSKSCSTKKKRRHREDDDKAAASTSISDTIAPTDFDSSDPVDAFLLSIGATLKTFSAYHLNLAKSKIFAVVQEHDLQQIVEKQNHDSEAVDVKTTSADSMYKND